MKITSFSLNNFAPEEFFGGAKSVSMNGPKFSKSDRTMKAFSFVERNNLLMMRLQIDCAREGCKQSQTDIKVSDQIRLRVILVASHQLLQIVFISSLD